MTIYQILSLIGFPALATACFFYLLRQFIKQREENKAIRLGLQALLRSEMIKDWNHYHDKGYAPIYAKDNFENIWSQYHNLGVNGVMDELHNAFMLLPTEEGE